MKKLLLALVFLLMAVPAHAEPRYQIINVFDDEAVASTGSATSPLIDLTDCDRIEALYVFARSSSGTADVKIEYNWCLQTSADATANCSGFDATDIVSSSVTEFVTDEALTAVDVPNLLTQVTQFKVTGVNSNPADALVDLDILCRQN